MNRHAYLIMAHNNFPLLLDLIELLDHERNEIYLHIDKKVPEAEFARLKEECARQKQERALKSPLHFTERISVHWGGYSQIACELLLLKAACKGRYAYYHLLSGSDLPIKTAEEILAFFDNLTANAGKEFLAFDSLEAPPYVRERISLYHILRESSFFLAEPLDALFTRLQRLLRVDRLKGSGLKIQKGANWFSITDGFARYTLEREDWIARTFSRSVCADELFLQTLAANSPFAEQIYDPYADENSMANLRYVDWERGTGNSPYVFRPEDREILLGLPHLFARKFSQNIFKDSQKKPFP